MREVLLPSRYLSCCPLRICPVVALHPTSSVTHLVIWLACRSSVCLSVVVHIHMSALLFRSFPIVIAALSLSRCSVLKKKHWVRGTTIHSGGSSSSCWYQAMRDMNIFKLGTSFVACQYFSLFVPWIWRASSSRLVIAVVTVLAPVSMIHIVRALSHVDASSVRFTIFAPTIFGLTCVRGIGDGVSLGSFFPFGEIKARRAIGNFELDKSTRFLTWSSSALYCSFFQVLDASSFLHLLAQVLYLDNMLQSVSILPGRCTIV